MAIKTKGVVARILYKQRKLNEASDKGGTSVEDLEKDSHLDNLTTEIRWERFSKKAEDKLIKLKQTNGSPIICLAGNPGIINDVTMGINKIPWCSESDSFFVTVDEDWDICKPNYKKAMKKMVIGLTWSVLDNEFLIYISSFRRKNGLVKPCKPFTWCYLTDISDNNPEIYDNFKKYCIAKYRNDVVNESSKPGGSSMEDLENDAVEATQTPEMKCISLAKELYTRLPKEKKVAQDFIKNHGCHFTYGYSRSMTAAGFNYLYGNSSHAVFKVLNGIWKFSAAVWNDWKVSDTVKLDVPNDRREVTGRRHIEWEFSKNACSSLDKFLQYFLHICKLNGDDFVPEIEGINYVKPEKQVDYYQVGADDLFVSEYKKFATEKEAKEYAYQEADKECQKRNQERLGSMRFNYYEKPLDISKSTRHLYDFAYYCFSGVDQSYWVDAVYK